MSLFSEITNFFSSEEYEGLGECVYDRHDPNDYNKLQKMWDENQEAIEEINEGRAEFGKSPLRPPSYYSSGPSDYETEQDIARLKRQDEDNRYWNGLDPDNPNDDL